MKKNLLSIVLLLLNAIFVFAQPKSEIRAVWLTTNGGSDWPKQTYSEKAQKENLCAILDKLEEANFNTIIFQAQVKGDVLWDSEIQRVRLRYRRMPQAQHGMPRMDYTLPCRLKNLRNILQQE